MEQAFVDRYEENSQERMLSLLRQLSLRDVEKIRCFDSDASLIDYRTIDVKPYIALIDGEHTRKAVLADFYFCKRVIHPEGVIVFHDFGIIFPAIRQICSTLKRDQIRCMAVKLEGSVFAIC